MFVPIASFVVPVASAYKRAVGTAKSAVLKGVEAGLGEVGSAVDADELVGEDGVDVVPRLSRLLCSRDGSRFHIVEFEL